MHVVQAKRLHAARSNGPAMTSPQGARGRYGPAFRADTRRAKHKARQRQEQRSRMAAAHRPAPAGLALATAGAQHRCRVPCQLERLPRQENKVPDLRRPWAAGAAALERRLQLWPCRTCRSVVHWAEYALGE
jgi:hypothetical protein